MTKYICKECMIPCTVDVGNEVIIYKPSICPMSDLNDAVWKEVD